MMGASVLVLIPEPPILAGHSLVSSFLGGGGVMELGDGECEQVALPW